jgi:HEAT repeat protein
MFFHRSGGWLPLAEVGADPAAAVPAVLERLKQCDAQRRLLWFACLAQYGARARQATMALRPYLAVKYDDERFTAAATILCIDPEDHDAAAVLVEGAKTHSAAIRACAEITPKVKALVPLLIETLNDPADETRANAAEALGNMGPLAESAIPRLATLLADERHQDASQWAAARALAGIGKAAIPTLTKIVAKPGPSVGRTAAALFLGSFRAEAALVVPALTRALDDPEALVRVSAAAALGRLGKSAAPARAALTRATERRGNEFELFDDMERVLASWALTQLDR